MRRLYYLIFALLLANLEAADAVDIYTVPNLTETAGVATKSNKLMVLLLKKNDLPAGAFQKAITYCQSKKVTMVVGGPDAELVYTFLFRELTKTAKQALKGVNLVVVGPGSEDPRLRSLVEGFEVKYLYAPCQAG